MFASRGKNAGMEDFGPPGGVGDGLGLIFPPI
jgi:hypothetical protein